MTHNKPKNRQRATQDSLSFESLEPRQLMAGDTAIPLAINLSPNAIGPNSLVASQAAVNKIPSQPASQQPFSQRPQVGLIIPITTAAARTLDGTGNNVANPEWGSTDETLLRTAAADYSDGISSLAGADRPSARVVSNALSAQTNDSGGNDRGLSAYAYVWGQFLDHDLSLTSASTDSSATVPISVPTGDPAFDPNATGTQTISFHRSEFAGTTGDSAANPRQQVNELTSFIDGSMIYGADQATLNQLRSFVGGKLLIGSDGLPPVDEDGYFLAGDERANENVELTSMHTLFIREHNYWASRIAAKNPQLNDEAVFQQARAIVIGEIQAITYNEFLPSLLGNGAISKYRGYNPTVNPGIANEFSTAAYRLHTSINDDVEFFGNDGRAVRDEVALRDAFFNPDLLRETGIDSILKYVASTQSQEFDTQIVDSLRDFLFGQPGQGGFDLAALNIQRGRDHGLADYNTTRAAYGLKRVSSFAEITSDKAMQQALSKLYSSVDNIDLWVGMMAEDHQVGSSVGETARAIMVDQFERIRSGDRFWYQKVFTGKSLDQINSTTLASVISRNSSITNLQKNVFFFKAEVNGQVFADNNANRRNDRFEQGLAGISVQLLNDSGDVLATTTTDQQGRYSFKVFKETGDYQIRVVLTNRMQSTTSSTKSVLISRGDQTVGRIDFGVRQSWVAQTPTRGSGQQAPLNRATDLAFTGFDLLDGLGTERKAKA